MVHSSPYFNHLEVIERKQFRNLMWTYRYMYTGYFKNMFENIIYKFLRLPFFLIRMSNSRTEYVFYSCLDFDAL